MSPAELLGPVGTGTGPTASQVWVPGAPRVTGYGLTCPDPIHV